MDFILYLLLNTTYTYSKDVKPIFERKCITCHNSTPMNLNIYEDALKYKDKIRIRVWERKTMPPVGFITEAERKVIRDWIDQGAEE